MHKYLSSYWWIWNVFILSIVYLWLLENLTCKIIAMKANISNKSYAKNYEFIKY